MMPAAHSNAISSKGEPDGKICDARNIRGGAGSLVQRKADGRDIAEVEPVAVEGEGVAGEEAPGKYVFADDAVQHQALGSCEGRDRLAGERFAARKSIGLAPISVGVGV